MSAVDDLRRSYVELALVGGIDSLVDDRALNWLRLTGRLKCGANPAGLEPGEGAAFWPLSVGGTPPEEKVCCLAELTGSRSLKKTAAGCWDNSRREGHSQPAFVRWPNLLAACGLSPIIMARPQSPWNLATAISRVSSPNRDWLPPLLTFGSVRRRGLSEWGFWGCLAQGAFLRITRRLATAVVASMDDGTSGQRFLCLALEGC